jgi:Ferritin-like domain
MDRRGFLLTTAAAGTAALGGPFVRSARAVTEDDLAFANFGAASELLLKDFYANALQAKLLRGSGYTVLRQGRSAAARHATALSAVLTGAGDAAPVEEDFEFVWPTRTFRTAGSILTTGSALHRALQGAYQAGAASASEASYRVLYASLAAAAGQQLGALTVLSGDIEIHPFPVALDLEAASAALERYLG